MKKLLVALALATLAVFADGSTASARGGKGGCCCMPCGGCGYGYGGGCGYGGGYAMGGCGMGGCGMGGCGMGMGGYGGGMGGYGMGGYGMGGHVLAGVDTSTAIVSTAPVGQEAVMVVTLPENAVLTIDDAATTSTSGQRIFRSPQLESGKDYHYTLKARVSNNGKDEVITRDVTVRAGQVSEVSLTASPASSTATAMAR